MSAAAETLLALAIYNSWRRGDETIEMPSPAEIGATIDDAVNLLRKYDDLKARAERAEAEVKKLTGFYNEIVVECGHDRIVREYRQRGELLRDEANRRKEAEAELANIRALANRRNKRDHAQDTTHQLVAALDQALDIAQANLAADAAKTEAAR